MCFFSTHVSFAPTAFLYLWSNRVTLKGGKAKYCGSFMIYSTRDMKLHVLISGFTCFFMWPMGLICAYRAISKYLCKLFHLFEI